MQKTLAEALINKGVMHPGTLVYGRTRAVGLGQNLQMVPLELMMEEYNGKHFSCRDRLGKSYIMLVEDVQEVDGMDPARLASIFNIKSDGTDKAAGKKRGRKPKTTHIKTAMEGESHGEGKRTEDSDQDEPASA
jgi:hypothetical protein